MNLPGPESGGGVGTAWPRAETLGVAGRGTRIVPGRQGAWGTSSSSEAGGAHRGAGSFGDSRGGCEAGLKAAGAGWPEGEALQG